MCQNYTQGFNQWPNTGPVTGPIRFKAADCVQLTAHNWWWEGGMAPNSDVTSVIKKNM